MLKQRIITAALLILAVLWIVSTDIPYVFSGFTAIVLLLASWEWIGLVGIEKVAYKVGYLLFIIFVFSLTLLMPLGLNLSLAILALLWMFAAVVAQSFNKSLLLLNTTSLRFILGAPILVVGWLALNVLRQEPEGYAWTLYLLVLVWLADIAAFLVGKRWGKHPLAPKVSPNKTWEGAIAALVVSQIFTLIVLAWLPLYWESWRIFPIALLTTVFAIFGDLAESLLKRIAKVKDSGNLLPGHGGVLDRIDALIAAIPIFVLLRLAVF